MILAVAVTYTAPELQTQAQQLAIRLKLPLLEPNQEHIFSALLTLTPQHLELSLLGAGAPGPIYTDFLTGAAIHRYQHGGGRRQLLARAVGLHKKKSLTICDVCAGLGRDAFILACLGARVTMVERSVIIGALLQDGQQRAQQAAWYKNLFWQLVIMDGKQYLQQLPKDQRPQVIYLDPMFPTRNKSALVKKEMRILREIIGDDADATELLDVALKTAQDRVVVKRPRLADPIPGPTPSLVMQGKTSRFDIYLICDQKQLE